MGGMIAHRLNVPQSEVHELKYLALSHEYHKLRGMSYKLRYQELTFEKIECILNCYGYTVKENGKNQVTFSKTTEENAME